MSIIIAIIVNSRIWDMTYDLGDAATWEFFFPNVDKPLLVLPGEEPSVMEQDDREEAEV